MSIFSSYTDSELLIEIKLGNSGAFTELYDRYWQSLYNSAYKRLQEESPCKDILQDVFKDIWLRRTSLEIENMSAYLHTAVRFQVLKLVSRNKYVSYFIQPFENIIDISLKPDSIINEKEINILLKAWIDTLPQKRRKIFMMRYEERLSTKEIAQKLKISQKTVQNQLGNTLNSLRTRLSQFFVFFLQLPIIVSQIS
jgi:RNA polymerase sigma-70 factor (ECF subfamily)